ncbi:hypothetical protein QJS66_15850 [Kocuria rhizophila]|nr:hypothetical protein QJS66_15850 [Kocuria rhizophila]
MTALVAGVLGPSSWVCGPGPVGVAAGLSDALLAVTIATTRYRLRSR